MGDLKVDALTKNSLGYLDKLVLDLTKTSNSMIKSLTLSKQLTDKETLESLVTQYYTRQQQKEVLIKPAALVREAPQYQLAAPPSQNEASVIAKEIRDEQDKAVAAITAAIAGAAVLGESMLPGDVVDGGKYAEKDLYIGPPGDTDGQQTGLNMHLPGGIGAPIYAPIDLIYVSRGTDGMPSVGLQGTSDARGPFGSGFGYYAAYRFIKDGKQYEVLMGHLASMGYKGSKENQSIPKGTLLGYQGASGRSVRGDGSNKPYPHISLHVNGIGFGASNSVLVWFANLLGGATSTVAPATKKTNVPQQISSVPNAGRQVVAVVNNQSPQDSTQPSQEVASNTSLNKNYSNPLHILYNHTTFGVG